MRNAWVPICLAISLCLSGRSSAQTITVSAEPLNGGTITGRQCGQFIEYLCNLVPGMWGEQIYDGRFEGLSRYKVAFIPQTDFREKPWYPSGAVNRAEYGTDSQGPVSGRAAERIRVAGGPPCRVGIAQDGIAVERSRACRFSCYLRQEGVSGPVTVRLHRDGKTYASATFAPADARQKFAARLAPDSSDDNATIELALRGSGTLWIDDVSLMPEDTIGGWRPDVVAALKALRPGVIRFGGSALDSAGFGDFEWRDTVGPVERRKPLRAWGGLQPAGAGLEEIVQLMKASGAEPLICVRVTGRSAKDAADEVEYFNCSTGTPMGRLRAANGHAEPYAIRYWQVGNELAGPEYERKLPEFCRAMKAADPHILLCSSYPTPGVLRGAGRWLDFVCPHHYDCANLPGVMKDLADIRAMIKADAPPGRDIRVAVTEWNTTGGDWGLRRARLWTLENALACARYQNLMHRQCDLVEIACRSNLCNSFCSGIIQTDDHRLYETPTYFVQQLYATTAGARPLKVTPAFSPDVLPDVSATRSADGTTVTVFAVNPTLADMPRTLDLGAFGSGESELKIWTISDRDDAGEPDVTNGFGDPTRVNTVASTLHVASINDVHYTFPKLSITCIQFRER
ncbi:MAG TPA: alpha-L-arabinofuranosidase C-terminal domain-containing protein [Tepidisphaeraceae bacterium]|jgi:alpha-L-arabinofuranosidase